MAWRVFSQQGLKKGASSSPQHQGLSILGSQSTDPEQLRSDFGCCCNVCKAIFSDLYMEFHASPLIHNCIRAEFMVLVEDSNVAEDYTGPAKYIYLGRINVNSNEGTECPFGSRNAQHPRSNYDDLYVPENTLAIANRGKTEEQCCDMKFILVPAPYPSRLFLTDTHTLYTSDEGNTGLDILIRSVGNETVDPRICEGVHGSATSVRISTPSAPDFGACDFHGTLDMTRVSRDALLRKGEDKCCVRYVGSWPVGREISIDLCEQCLDGWTCAILDRCGCCDDPPGLVFPGRLCDSGFTKGDLCPE